MEDSFWRVTPLGQKLLRLSDPGIYMELNVHTPYGLKILRKSLQEHVTLKMEVPAARPRRKLSVLDTEGRCWRRTWVVSPQRSKELLLASHLHYQATLPSHSSTGQQENWTMSIPSILQIYLKLKNGHGSARLYRGRVAPPLPLSSGRDCRSVPVDIFLAADSRLSRTRVESSPPSFRVGATADSNLTLDIAAKSWLFGAAGRPPSTVPGSGLLQSPTPILYLNKRMFTLRGTMPHSPVSERSFVTSGSPWPISLTRISSRLGRMSRGQLVAFRLHLHLGPGRPQPPTGSRHRGIVHAGYHLSLDGCGVRQIQQAFGLFLEGRLPDSVEQPLASSQDKG